MDNIDLVCPAGNFPSAKAAVDNGANAIYLGFKDETNARHFPGLNFNDKTIQKAINYAHEQSCKVFIAINTYPQPTGWSKWTQTVDKAANCGADALIMADIGLMEHTLRNHPNTNIHLSVQGSASNIESLKFFKNNFNIRRAVLPRVLTIPQINSICNSIDLDIEVFGFGSLCVMTEGRCHLSSYATGESPNTSGACSPAKFVRWHNSGSQLECRLNDILLDSFDEKERAGYPTPCKGRYCVNNKVEHTFEKPTSLNTIKLLPQILNAGVRAIKIEGRQRSPAYIAQVTNIWRQALDRCLKDTKNYHIDSEWLKTLAKVSEGSQTTFGAYSDSWK